MLRVALPVPLRRQFDYLLPRGWPDAVAPGSRVLVPFGPRQLVGVVLSSADSSSVPAQRLRRVSKVLDQEPSLPPDILELILWASRYYHAPIGEAVHTALPALLRQLRPPARERLWKPTMEAMGLDDDALSRAPRQAEALQLLRARGSLDAQALIEFGLTRALMRALAKRGLAEESEAAPALAPGCDSDGSRQAESTAPPALNAAQRDALDNLMGLQKGFSCTLLEGVTGSGKTEVYLQFIARTLEQGGQVLVLIPEIGLTPQAQQRFVERFGSGVSVIHSGLAQRQRHRIWQLAKSGELRVLIGTRSSVFTPLPRLGLIVVDEEHDGSFKQQDGIRYSARDIAVYRARQRDIPVLLGSATPSVETLGHALSGRYRHLRLPERAGGASLPDWRLIDIRHVQLEGGLGQQAIEAIRSELQADNQVLVFLNRRGWSPVLMCHDCGWTAECRACDARMTLHREAGRLWCHHCDRRQRVPPRCPHCKSDSLLAPGQGTEKCEHSLRTLFPEFEVRRIDRGTTQKRDAMAQLLQTVDEGEPLVLVGTQMLAKGHHFPHVTLVVVVDADSGLFAAEFRAMERTAQLLVQVAGRAGRASRPGRVLVQTHNPGHPLLQALSNGAYDEVARQFLRQRKSVGLPPFGHLALLWFDCPDPGKGPDILDELRRSLQRSQSDVDIVGPIPAPLRRRGGRYRDQLLFQSSSRRPLHGVLDQCCVQLEALQLPRRSRWVLDVDPLDGV